MTNKELSKELAFLWAKYNRKNEKLHVDFGLFKLDLEELLNEIGNGYFIGS